MADRLARLWRHPFARFSARVFDDDSLQRIASAVAEGELRHRGELCFAVEVALAPMAILRGVHARERAHEVFAQLRVWNTHADNGVLIYLLLADRRIEIVADRGLDGRVDAQQWNSICTLMQARLRAGKPEAAVITGANAIADLLAAHFPRVPGEVDENELPDRPRVL